MPLKKVGEHYIDPDDVSAIMDRDGIALVLLKNGQSVRTGLPTTEVGQLLGVSDGGEAPTKTTRGRRTGNT